jgi:parvulin-like peptidyl-prolyl isomerase
MHILKLTAFLLWLILLLSACGVNEVLPTATLTAPDLPRPTDTLTSLPPTPTSEPLAARVNGEVITLSELEAELARYLAAATLEDPVDEGEARRLVLDDLIAQVLLAQGATENGFKMDASLVASKMNQVIASSGGEETFNRWLEEFAFTRQSFEEALTRSVQAAWMRDQVIADVPKQTEQVHALQILLYNLEQADQALVEINAGTNFATLAATYDPITGGDLGWFPRGYLTDEQLEEAAFNLQPGEYTEVIQTDVGFHILQVIERDPARTLDPEARLIWQEAALKEWIDEHRNVAQIEIFIP